MPYFLRSSHAKAHTSEWKNDSQGRKIIPIEVPPSLNLDFPALLEAAVAHHDQTFEEDGSTNISVSSNVDTNPMIPHSSEARPLWIERNLDILMGQNAGNSNNNTASLSRSHQRRKRKRNLEVLELGHTPRPSAKKALLDVSTPIPTSLDTEELPATSCGYQARNVSRSLQPCTENKNLDKLIKEGYTYITWNGCDPRPILDSKRRVIGVLAGRPTNHLDYDLAGDRIFQKLLSLGDVPEMQQTVEGNRRGAFPALNIGVTHGKGTTSPVNLHQGRKGKPSKYATIVEDVLNDADLRMLATYGSYCLATWAPEVYYYYHSNLSRLWEKEPHLQQIFPKSVFPSAALNAGPDAWTRRHRDSMNCAFGMCSIHALGKFDHTRGGHLVLPNLELVIEFPANSTILIPSATLVHANVPILPGDQRASFTQYCAGGLFRYIDNLFMTEKRLKLANPIAYEKVQAQKALRWKTGLDLLSTFEELVEEVKDA